MDKFPLNWRKAENRKLPKTIENTKEIIINHKVTRIVEN